MPDFKQMGKDGHDAFGNFSAGYDVGSPGNGFERFTSLLNMAGHFAPTLGLAGAAFGVGLNGAARVNNTVAVVDKF